MCLADGDEVSLWQTLRKEPAMECLGSQECQALLGKQFSSFEEEFWLAAKQAEKKFLRGGTNSYEN